MISDEFSTKVFTIQFLFYSFCVVQIAGFYFQMKLFLYLKKLFYSRRHSLCYDLINSALVALLLNFTFLYIWSTF